MGEGHERMIAAIDHAAPLLPEARLRYLMGVGYPVDILEAVKRGVDMFDCVLPTRNGRNALAFTSAGPICLRNSQYIRDTNPLDASCDCMCCRHFSRGYLRHIELIDQIGSTR